MSLDVNLIMSMPATVYTANITHNLTVMAGEADLYKALWRPEELGFTRAHELIPLLREGLARLRERPEYFRNWNPDNGWGDYEKLVEFAEQYLNACETYPDAKIGISR